MRLSYRLTSCFCLLFSLAQTWGLAQSTDSLKHRLAALLEARQERVLKDTDYLRSVDSIAPLLEQQDSLPQWLATYRDLAFSDPRQLRRRANYYTFLALNAYNTNKFGSAIFYSEKNNEARIAAGLFEKGAFSHADLFALSVYYNNRNYTRATERFLQLYPALARVPATVGTGKETPEQTWLALSLLQAAVYTFSKTGDSAHLEQSFHLAADILARARRQAAKYSRYQPQLIYLEANMAFQRARFFRQPQQAAGFLRTAIDAVRANGFPANLVTDYSGSLYREAVEFYFDRNNPDSARYYLNLLRAQDPNSRFAVMDPVFLLDNESRLMAGDGHPAEAYERLRKAWLLRDSAFYAVSADRDNNLYALAEADNAHTELLRSEEKKRAAEKANLLLFFLLFLLVLAGLAVFLINRARQRRRLLNLQIHLARNFHDAIGPMLLYANALVKKQMDDQSSPYLIELKTHIAQIMTEVRSIAHDLKSTHFDTINGFSREITTLLEKVSAATGIAFVVKVDNGDQPLSHLQLIHLSNIVRELVGNSIKHAGCDKISLEITGVKRTLHLHYSDNGKGLDPTAPSAGIGLQNIRERADSLRGNCTINNAWPEGYSIHLSIPLL
jgi:signal transduction histidine kinase